MTQRKKRFQSTHELAEKLGSWNNNEVCNAIAERLELENEQGMQIGFGNLSKAFNAIPRKSKSHKDLKFNTPIEELQGNVEAGYYPPPEVMIAISRCFKNYLNGRGNISLDEAFFGEPYSKRKSFAYKQSKTDCASEYVLFAKWLNAHKGLSLEKGAELFLKTYSPNRDTESFLRAYRRYKSGQ